MREILFRGKSVNNGEWMQGSLVIDTIEPADDAPIKYYHIADMTIGEFPNGHQSGFDETVDPSTIGQYTGLTDKNGKRIFEGDIFKFPDEVWESYYTSCGTEYNSWNVENYGVVGYCEDHCRFEFVQYKYNENSVEADIHENGNIEFSDFVRGLEIIGTVHDNPELLEGGGLKLAEIPKQKGCSGWADI